MTSPFVSHGEELHVSNLSQQELLRGMAERGVPLRTTVRGFSMAPFIRDRDVVTIAPITGVEPRVGDVVAFTLSESGRFAIHRVVARIGEGWLMRGDSAPQADAVVTREQLIGRVVRVERDGRDVHVGLGGERAWIGALSRAGGLHIARTLWRLPRRVASTALRRAQGVPTWRAAGRRLGLRYAISVASADEVRAVQRRLDPDAEVAAVSRRLNPVGLDAAPALDPDVTDWVARSSGRVAGYVQCVSRGADHAPWDGHWLFSLVVWGPYRGLGIGEALTRTVVEQARSRGASELLLVVYEDNLPAIRLYEKLGFARITRPALEPLLAEEKAQTGRRRIVMRRWLSQEEAAAKDSVTEATAGQRVLSGGEESAT